MSDGYYWPSVPGEYEVYRKHGRVDTLKLWPDGLWSGDTFINYPARELGPRLGYLGVRREKPDDTIYVSPERSTLAIEALAAFRACKQQPDFANWAFTFGPALCRELGAV